MPAAGLRYTILLLPLRIYRAFWFWSQCSASGLQKVSNAAVLYQKRVTQTFHSFTVPEVLRDFSSCYVCLACFPDVYLSDVLPIDRSYAYSCVFFLSVTRHLFVCCFSVFLHIPLISKECFPEIVLHYVCHNILFFFFMCCVSYLCCFIAFSSRYVDLC